MGISSSFTRCSDGIDTALAFSIWPADGLFLLLAVVPLFTVFFIILRWISVACWRWMAIEGVVGVMGVWLIHESCKLIFSVPQGVNQNDSMQDTGMHLDSTHCSDVSRTSTTWGTAGHFLSKNSGFKVPKISQSLSQNSGIEVICNFRLHQQDHTFSSKVRKLSITRKLKPKYCQKF